MFRVAWIGGGGLAGSAIVVAALVWLRGRRRRSVHAAGRVRHW
jgi:hypothetical protein